MKKILLTLVAVMTMSFANAETEGLRTHRHVVDYDMSFDINRLAAKLDLTNDQMEAVEVIQENFNDEVLEAATARGHERRFLVHQAVRKDVQQMHRVLNDEQFNTYMMLLGATLQNKHL